MPMIQRKCITGLLCFVIILIFMDNISFIDFWLHLHLTFPSIVIYGGIISYYAEKLAKHRLWLSLLYHWLGGILFPLVAFIVTLQFNLQYSAIDVQTLFTFPSVVIAFIYWVIDRILFYVSRYKKRGLQ
ncbi:hypothetical protein [Melghirimyces algeriensis]|uniref:DUF3021 domain-containing protein n=1 Tax=Melghirimyces algeriensis TaxID=910412 RepID=A0A521FD62_9BACL|nr:hypothetical protein [Melghirimyces algeriensis]SMO93541.1 hypothetical protein SAMN06264849_1169 [Melghirimyces algeriensis]